GPAAAGHLHRPAGVADRGPPNTSTVETIYPREQTVVPQNATKSLEGSDSIRRWGETMMGSPPTSTKLGATEAASVVHNQGGGHSHADGNRSLGSRTGRRTRADRACNDRGLDRGRPSTPRPG